MSEIGVYLPGRSPLHRLLLGRTEGDPEPALRVKVADDDVVLSALQAWGWPEEISVEPVAAVPPLRWQPPADPPPALAAARLWQSPPPQ